jgi:4-amino-4-deoxy-L-arabinose transferase-like glycosyltransferase
MNRSALLPSLFIAFIAAVLFIPFLGAVHLFDWDEINFAECAREMVVTGDYSTVQIGFLPFWEKPPLFIWMQAASMHFFDDPEFAARFPNALCGIFTLVIIYLVGKRIYDEKFARIWTLAYAGSLLPNFYFHSGIIDPWFNLFIFLGIYQFALYANDYPSVSTQKPANKRIILSSLFIALAVLTKGPVALLVFGLCFLVWRIRLRKPVMSWQHFGLYAGISVIVPGLWFLWLALNGKGNVVIEFILYQVRLFSTEDAGHGGSFFYHWIILLAGCFPASVFAIRALLKKGEDTPFEVHMLKWMRILFWVVLILFSIVKTKIIHYSSLCYFPLTYLAAYTIYKLINGTFAWKKWMTFLLVLIGAGFSFALTVLPFFESFKQQVIDAGWVKDPFALANLSVKAQWNGFEWLTGIAFGAAVAGGIFLFLRKKNQTAFTFLFTGSLVATTAAVILITPRIEEYSQGPAIAYWEAHANPDFYLETIGYKSYAHYFYGNASPVIAENRYYTGWRELHKDRFYNPKLSKSENEIALRREWMINGPIDYPAYFLCKNTFRKEILKYYRTKAPGGLRFTGEKFGYVSWERVP